MSSTLLEAILAEARKFLLPIQVVVEDPVFLVDLLGAIGVPADTEPEPAILAGLAAIDGLRHQLEAWPPGSVASLDDVGAALDLVLAAMDAVRALESVGLGPAKVGEDLLRHLTSAYLQLNQETIYTFALLAALIEPETVAPVVVAGKTIRNGFVRDRFRFDRLVPLVSNPRAAFREEYFPAGLPTATSAEEAAKKLFPRLAKFLRQLGVPAHFGVPEVSLPVLGDAGSYLRHSLLLSLPSDLSPTPAGAVVTLSSDDRGGLGIVVSPYGVVDAAGFVDRWSIESTATSGLQVIAAGPQGMTLLSDDDRVAAQARLRAKLDPADPDEPAFVLGASESSHLAVGAVEVLAELDVSAARKALALGATASRCALVISPGEEDGFLRQILPAEGLRADFDLGLMWSSELGLVLRGSAGLQATLPVNLELGPVRVDNIDIGLLLESKGLALTAGAQLGVKLGPVQATVDGIGLRAELGWPDQGGNLGIFDLDFALQPPSGIGLSIDTSLVTGGGFLKIDAAHGRYVGGLALEAQGIALSALGLLDSKIPGGGYSLVAIVTSQFTPIQLGLGFTLNGVGGLLGINRKVDVEALREALRGPGIGDLLFADNPMAQAARLLGDLGRYFPVAKGRHVFGPAVKIGWGTPTVVEAELGLLLEVPSPVRTILVGNVRAVLPSKSSPIIKLNVDVVGELDLAQKRLAIDASLRDSTVAGLAVTGDLAYRMSWGDPPSFLFSVGGFHSQFRAPAGFPKLRRVAIPIGSGDNPRLDASGFLALTSNTAQVGAQVELYAAAGSLNLKGSIGFEALLELSPFSFRADLSAGISLRRHSKTLAGVHLDATLVGPTPWRVWGEACLSLWLYDLCVDFDATFGNKHSIEAPKRKVWNELRPALENKQSWSGIMPARAKRVVSTAPAIDSNAGGHLDPLATLSVRQKVAPLERQLTRFGAGKPDGVDRFKVTLVKLGGQEVPPAQISQVKDWFAPAQFEDLDAAKKLSRESFEPMVAGVSVASDAIKKPTAELIKSFDFETIVLRAVKPSTIAPRTLASQLLGLAGSGVAAQVPAFAPAIGKPPLVALDEESYVIVSTSNLKQRLDIVAKGSHGEAQLALKAYLAQNPAEQGALQVVPLHEAV